MKEYLTESALGVFLIAFVLFLVVLGIDGNQSDGEERDTVDKIWIGIFFIVIIGGILGSIYCVWQTDHHISKRFGAMGNAMKNIKLGIPSNIPKFGIPRFFGKKYL